MPEPYSAQWAYLPAKNRSAGALSLAEGEVIMRTILMVTLKSTWDDDTINCPFKVNTIQCIDLIQGFPCW